MFFASTAPILRRGRHSTRAAAHTATAHTTTSSDQSSNATNSAASLPHAEPCLNYFELFPEEVGAVGNVEVADAAEAHQWQLVGRPVSQAEAEERGGCVKITLDNGTSSSSPVYYSITDSDDEVYGRAAYLPRCDVSAAWKEEPMAFTEESNCDCTTDGCEEADADFSVCGSPCGSNSSSTTRCVYPTQSATK